MHTHSLRLAQDIRAGLLAGALLLPALGHQAFAQGVLFSDDFDTDTTAQWDTFAGSGTGTPDFTAQFAFDYSSHGIPSAPGSVGGTTRGVKLTVNKNDSTPDTSAVSLFPKDKSFSGNYAVRFWMWINYNGAAYGGEGSTEFAVHGINHAGGKPVWPDANASDSDGVFFAVTGEGGASGDYRTYFGVPGAPYLRQTGVDSGILDRDANGQPDQEAFDRNPATSPLRTIFPSPPFETPEVPGKQWVLCELRQLDGTVTWSMNGWVLAEVPAASLSTSSGNFSIGTMDVFTSIANPKEQNFVIYDNVSVVDLGVAPSLARVTASVTDPALAEPGNDPATVTFTRTGSTASTLQVRFSFAGTAVPGVDFSTNNMTGVAPGVFAVTIPAGAPSVDLVINALNDAIGEPEESVLVALAPSPGAYEIGLEYLATLQLVDDGDQTTVTIAAANDTAYERDAEDTVSFRLTRAGFLGDDLPVRVTYGGTASASDYSGGVATVTLPAGEASVLLVLAPTDDSQLEGDETVTATLGAGTGYVVGAAASATATIRDDERPTAPVLYSEGFDTDVSANWNAVFSAGSGGPDSSAVFGFDYANESVPPAPGGSTRGLRVAVNKDATAAAAALNLYLKDKTFSGNYAVRFNLFLNYDPFAAGTTEHSIFGINHSGTIPNRHGLSGGDGLWFAIETDGSSQGGVAYISYLGRAGNTPELAGRPAADFRAFFEVPPFVAAGVPSGRWADVELVYSNKVASMVVNGVTTVVRTAIGGFESGTVMLGHMDRFNSIGGLPNASYFDNLRVVDLGGGLPPATAATIGTPSLTATTLTIPFAATTGEPGQFELRGSTSLSGPFTPVAGAVISSTGPGALSVTAPLPAGDEVFFKVVTK